MESIVRVVSWVLSLASFLTGGLIYLAFRSETLLMFRWGEKLGLGNMITQIRSISADYLPLPQWVLFSLPDGLWVLSYVFAMAAIWVCDLTSHRFLFFLIPFIAIGSEILQSIGLVQGSFDWIDLFLYFLATIIGTFYCIIIKRAFL